MATYLDKDGNEVEALTPEEAKAQADAAIAAAVAAKEAELKAAHEAAIAAEKAHTKEKLEQFQQANKGIENEKEVIKTLAEQAKQTAEEAKAAIAAAEAEKIATKKEYWIKSIVGNDPELTKKINDNYELINLPASTDAEIAERVQKAVNMAGIGAISAPGSVSFAGAMPTHVAPTEQAAKEHNYNVWKNELGLQDFIPKPSAEQK